MGYFKNKEAEMRFNWFGRKPRAESATRMSVAVNQEMCTADGICETWCSQVFVQLPDGKYGVRESRLYFAEDKTFDGLEGEGHEPSGMDGWARVPVELEDAVEYVARNCAGECVYTKRTD